MKKFRFGLVFISLIFFSAEAFSQSAKLAEINRKTAERCLKIAENYILADEWNSALSQAELGLSYDSFVSDLLYIKAMAQDRLGATRAEILKTIKAAFDADTWLNYNKNGARILYADLLCGVGSYEESLAVLNDEGFIYSADAEFIRIKNFYRIASAASIEQARLKINSARKIYPSDSRFQDLFFTFEYSFMIKAWIDGIEYSVPALVQTIADAYIENFPDYASASTEVELLASFFAKGQTRTRLVKAIEAKNSEHPLFPVAALAAGTISEQKAYDLFVETLSKEISISLLTAFISLLKDEALIQDLSVRLTAFEGTLYIDEDLDLQNELVVQYLRGRPQYVQFDRNMDGEKDLYSVCDFGVPLFVSFEGGLTEVFYDSYPCVNCVNKNKENAVYYFLNDDFIYTPFDMIILPSFSRLGVNFYIPFINPELLPPQKKEMLAKTSCIELTASENGNSKVVYTFFDGRPVFANFTDTQGKFAYSSMEEGFPFVRYVDYDRDGIFETSETYDIDIEKLYDSEDEHVYIKKIFGDIPFAENLYLNKVEIDRNNDTIIEFKEEFLGNGNKLTSWDNDGNGVWDYEYYRFADPFVEEIYFYSSNGLPRVVLTKADGIPQKIKVGADEIPVVKGSQNNIYWIGERSTFSDENAIAKEVISAENGVVCIVQNKEKRFSVIKIDELYFCRKLPESYITDDEDEILE